MTAKEIKYVLIETVLNNKDKPIAELVKTSKIGLLKGLQYKVVNDPDKEEPFLIMKDRDDSLISVNLNFYNILSIEKFNELYKTIVYFRASDEEQDQATAKVLKIINDFKEADRVLNSNKELIDTSTYSNVPSTFRTGDGGSVKVHTGTGSQRSVYTPPRSSTPSRTSTSDWNKPKKPSVIKRKSKINKALIDEMEKKIAEIMSGNFKANLPKIAIDPPGVVSTEIEDDDEYYATYFPG